MRLDIPLPRIVRRLGEAVADAGGRAMLVGGSVRDHLLDTPIKDHDIECYGLTVDALERALKPLGRVSSVGRAFAVLKLFAHGQELDVSLPRRDSKVGTGHRGILAEADPTMSPTQAALRRDLTVNAMMVDLVTRELLDPYGGQRDLEAGLLRPVDPDTFLEDPLRALRAVQFAARLGFQPTDTLVQLCRDAALCELPSERVRGELDKLLLKGTDFHVAFDLARRSGVFERVLPEAAPWSTPAAADRLNHLAAHHRALVDGPGRRWSLLLAAWFADAPADALVATLERLKVQRVGKHDAAVLAPALHAALTAPLDTDVALRWLATKVEIDLAWRAQESLDPSQPQPARAHLRAAALGILHQAAPQWVMGRDLLKLGWTRPGPHLGTVLQDTYAAQLNGQLADRDAALAHAKRWLDAHAAG